MLRIDFPAKFNVRKNISLKKFTSIQIGGHSDFLTIIYTKNQFIELFKFCKLHGIRILPIGQGTNLFFSDAGFKGIVAVLAFDKIEAKSENIVIAEAGAPLSELNVFCINHSLTGFEFTAGIPGTVGGAIFGNAGAYGHSVGGCLVRAEILTADGKVELVNRHFFEFSYRSSNLKKYPRIVLKAEFKFNHGNRAEIKREVNKILSQRRQKLPPPELPTAGSYFKNLKDEKDIPIPVARLLDDVGGKKFCAGDAAVYQKHANIIYNKGQATANDVLKLETILKKRVYEKFGVNLEREVIYVESV